MDKPYTPRKNILSSPWWAGRKRGSWKWERVFSAVRQCTGCGGEMRPWIGQSGIAQSEVEFRARRFCTGSCAKKHENPMAKDSARLKMQQTLRSIGHAPKVRGGNGRALTHSQQAMMKVLGPEWRAEFAIPTKIPRGNGYPPCYKVDLGNPASKMAIELDGQTHFGKRRLLDRKKDDLLATLGWKVFRVTNKHALSLCSTFTSPDTLLISLEAF